MRANRTSWAGTVSPNGQEVVFPENDRHEVVGVSEFCLVGNLSIQTFFVDLSMGISCPRDMQSSDCPLILGWTACEPSTHHFVI